METQLQPGSPKAAAAASKRATRVAAAAAAVARPCHVREHPVTEKAAAVAASVLAGQLANNSTQNAGRLLVVGCSLVAPAAQTPVQPCPQVGSERLAVLQHTFTA